MKNLIIALLFIAGLSACKKDKFEIKENSIIGTWYSEKAKLQFEIFDTDGTDHGGVSFTRYKENGVNYLKYKHQNISEVYEIQFIGKGELWLKDSKGVQVGFYRVN